MFPGSFVYNQLELDQIENYIKRQKVAKEHIHNPWSVLLLDDCTDDPRIFNNPIFQGLFKNGRHWKMLFILSLQYCLDVKPVIRTNVDGCFILRETNLKNRKALWENYAGVIPDFSQFCDLLETEILKIKNDCKYLPPLHVYESWQKNKHNYTTSLNNYASDSKSIQHDNILDSPVVEEKDDKEDSVKLQISHA